jgi:hypothetical protein
MTIIGYRCWIYSDKFRQLMSPLDGTNWPPGEAKTHGRPWLDINLHTHAGIYANKRYDDLVSGMLTPSGKKFLRTHWWEGPQAEYLPTALVFGTIRLWGKVVEHTVGYRGECASVRSLISISKGPDFDKIDSNSLDLNVVRLMYCPLGISAHAHETNAS